MPKALVIPIREMEPNVDEPRFTEGVAMDSFTLIASSSPSPCEMMRALSPTSRIATPSTTERYCHKGPRNPRRRVQR